MVCLESVFAGLREVYFFWKEITAGDRKRGNLNFSLVGDMWPDLVLARLSLDNLAGHPHTGDH